ncbi:MAG: hypothetical protein ACREO7_11030 [Pseudoxanthomonas sp.]
MTVESSHWMDRLRSAESSELTWPATLVPGAGPEPIDVVNARNALRYRRSLMRDASQPLLKPRRNVSFNTRIPKRVVLAVIMATLGVILSYAGSAYASQPLLLAGFGCALVGVLAGCIALATLLDFGIASRTGAQGVPAQQQLASAEQIAAMKRAARADPELGILINGWWKNPAPISLHDVALVLAFQKARAIAVRADSTLH